jgi:hypothetical protein
MESPRVSQQLTLVTVDADPRARGLDSRNGKKTGEEAVNELMRTHYFDRRTAQDWIKEIVG